MEVLGLRSCYDTVQGICYFGRMLDKARLHAAGQLPADYVPYLGKGFDARCCSFLRVSYPAVAQRVQQGATEEEILAWCFQQGGVHGDDEIFVWNEFMRKRGWRDEASARLKTRVEEYGLTGRSLETLFDMIDADEGRPPRVL